MNDRDFLDGNGVQVIINQIRRTVRIVSEMPTVQHTSEHPVVLYIGNTDANYHHGCMYEYDNGWVEVKQESMYRDKLFGSDWLPDYVQQGDILFYCCDQPELSFNFKPKHFYKAVNGNSFQGMKCWYDYEEDGEGNPYPPEFFYYTPSSPVTTSSEFFTTHYNEEYIAQKTTMYEAQVVVDSIIDSDTIEVHFKGYEENTRTFKSISSKNISSWVSIMHWEETFLNNVADPQYIVISDSYGGRNNDGDVTRTWEEILCGNLHTTEGEDFFYTWLGGAGFANGKFLEIIKALLGDTATETPEYASSGDINFDRKTVVVVGGGANDIGSTKEQIRAGIVAFTEYLASKFKEVEVKLAWLAWGDIAVDTQHTAAQYNAMMEMSRVWMYPQGNFACKTSYIANSEYILSDNTLFQSDGYHPNGEGHAFIGVLLTNGVLNGYCSIKEDYQEAPIATVTNGLMTSTIDSVSMSSSLHNNLVYLRCQCGKIACDENKVVSSGWIPIASCTGLKFVRGRGDGQGYTTLWLPMNVLAEFTSSTTTGFKWGNLNCIFRFNKGVLEGLFTGADEGQLLTNIRIKTLIIPGWSWTFDAKFV